jgi:hypothetical protein
MIKCIKGCPMFSQIVTISLIISVVFCPLACTAGLCQAQCCALGESCEVGSQSSKVDCPSDETTCGCCDPVSSADSQPASPRKCPKNSPAQCQCFCGGAVLEKPSELIDGSSFVLPLLCDSYTFDSILNQHRTVAFEFPTCDGSKNHGRHMRTLLMSFLC